MGDSGAPIATPVTDKTPLAIHIVIIFFKSLGTWSTFLVYNSMRTPFQLNLFLQADCYVVRVNAWPWPIFLALYAFTYVMLCSVISKPLIVDIGLSSNAAWTMHLSKSDILAAFLIEPRHVPLRWWTNNRETLLSLICSGCWLAPFAWECSWVDWIHLQQLDK